ncbi:HAD family hydrolase [Thermodesulfobacteriota bacterium]
MPDEKLNDILEFVEKQGPAIKCVSFDVFDTLMHRKIAPPDQVMVPAARSVVELLQSYGIKESLIDCMRVRRNATSCLQNEALRADYDPECNIREIIIAWLQHYLPAETANENWKPVLRIELEAEKSVCMPLPGIKEIVLKIKQSGKRIIYVSDMYLGLQEISEILDAAGFDDIFDAGYVSADIKFNKKSGRLFDYVLKQERLIPAEICHIGDNLRSDCLVPAKLGIPAFHFRDIDFENWAVRHRKLKKLSRMNPSWEGARWVEMVPPDPGALQLANVDFSYGIGYFVLGPVLVNFIHQVIDRITRDHSELVLFPAREGFILREIYEKLANQLEIDALPPCEYIFLSRQSTFLASVNVVGEREIVRGLQTQPTLRKLLKKLSLEPSQFEILAKECGFNGLDDRIDRPGSDNRLDGFLSNAEFQRVLSTEREILRSLLYDYLKQFNFWDYSNIAFVDVGWTGTIQESLALAFADKSEWPLINGYYLGLLDRSKARRHDTKKSNFSGIFYDYRYSENRTGIDRFTELLENATRAPHATTIGYKRGNNGKVLPILSATSTASYNAEQLDRYLVASLQAGILDYAETYSQMLIFQTKPPEANQEFIVRLLDRLIRYPTKNEAQILKDFVYTNDFGGFFFMPGTSQPLATAGNVTPERNPSDRKYYFVWPEGFYATTRIPGLTTLFNIYRSLFKQTF